MLGKGSDWVRWLLVLGALVLCIRALAWLALPLLPAPFAWTSSVMLGAALTLFLVPLPHEKMLGDTVDGPWPERRGEPSGRPDHP